MVKIIHGGGGARVQTSPPLPPHSISIETFIFIFDFFLFILFRNRPFVVLSYFLFFSLSFPYILFIFFTFPYICSSLIHIYSKYSSLFHIYYIYSSLFDIYYIYSSLTPSPNILSSFFKPWQNINCSVSVSGKLTLQKVHANYCIN